ncbi:hypothetical protein [Agrococcus carbonis]|uniref:Uncharacterized protein n=1 Tax=Agrococcus carbonis TaxID=684552 RepID=A0A1H1RGR4_9MICO|nr:hypothetical protein [Agrococcus carbonis]SDS34872.1 hypothetical protein SAMN04489719_2115 [Agrococcus carbonis]
MEDAAPQRAADMARVPAPASPEPAPPPRAASAPTDAHPEVAAARARRRSWLLRWALQLGVPLLVGSLTLVATAWQIGSELERTREAEQRTLAISGNVQMLRAASAYQAANTALADHMARNGYDEWPGTDEELAAALAEDERYLDLVQDVNLAHDDVANAFNELLVYGDSDAVAAARVMIDEMVGFDSRELPVSEDYASAQDRFVRNMCEQLSRSPEQCTLKALR